MNGSMDKKDLLKEKHKIIQEQYRQLFENSPDGIVILDDELTIVRVNRSFQNMFGYETSEAVGQNILALVVPSDGLDEAYSIADCLLQGMSVQCEAWRKKKDGEIFPVSILAYPILYNNQRIGIYLLYTDISARKAAEEKLKYISLHDSLTGLYNRTYFEEYLVLLQKNPPPRLTILAIDIDCLKIINDTLGHNMGDELLINTSKILKNCLQEDATIARIGGDEFVIVLPGYGQAETEELLSYIKENIDAYNIDSVHLPINLSIGYAVSEDEPQPNYNQLFIEADNNMYRDKIHRGKSARSAIVQTLMVALEARDFITEGHAERLGHLVGEMAAALDLPKQSREELQLLAKFHDIGKVGIPDSILFKTGPLTPSERKTIQRHSEIGYRIAQSAPDLVPISDWILKHHEWWNGKGYPLGLKGEEIPLECRILAIADAYDSMTSDRPYRSALSHEAAIGEILGCGGSQFDPEMVGKVIHVLKKSPSSIIA